MRKSVRVSPEGAHNTDKKMRKHRNRISVAVKPLPLVPVDVVVGAGDPIYQVSNETTTDLLDALEGNPTPGLEQMANVATNLAKQVPIASPGASPIPATAQQQVQAQQQAQQVIAAAQNIAQTLASPAIAAAQQVAQPVINKAAQDAGKSAGDEAGKSLWTNFPVWGKVAVGFGFLLGVIALAKGHVKKA